MIDSAGRSAVVEVGRYPSALVLTPDGTRAYVTNYDDGSVSVIDTDPKSDSCNTVTGTLDVGLCWSTGVVLSGDGSRAYAVDQVDGHLSVIDTVADSRAPRHRHGTHRTRCASDRPLRRSKWPMDLHHQPFRLRGVGGPYRDEQNRADPRAGLPVPYVVGPNGLRLYASLTEDGSTCVIDTDPGSATYHRIIARLHLDGYGRTPSSPPRAHMHTWSIRRQTRCTCSIQRPAR